MRALVCHAYGPIDNLKIEDIPQPVPKAGEVLVRVRAAGVSFAAMLGVQGKHQNKPPLPYVPGNELAGHVVALGEGVSNVEVGDRIATGVSQGAFAEYAIATAANLIPIPEQLPYAEATNFPTLYPTAYGALKWKAAMQPGEVLLVHGAGGGSGLTAIEVGKAMGAVVIASAGGADKLKAAQEAGADRPRYAPMVLVDRMAGLQLCTAITSALVYRERTGKGAHVSSNLMANGVWAASVLAQAKLVGAKFLPRRTRENALNAVTNHYQCQDGRWLILSLLTGVGQYTGPVFVPLSAGLVECDSPGVGGVRQIVLDLRTGQQLSGPTLADPFR